ncbi:MAG TPA: hypothetical protein VFH44_05315 [Solirubrobacterales bacterium]|nr:hypothetical protein [Solirubrobacterales bacterium]
MRRQVFRGRRPRFTVLFGTVAIALALAFATGRGDVEEPANAADQAAAVEHGHEDHGTVSPATHTEAGHELQDAMRKLWYDHVGWTRLVILDFIDGSPDLDSSLERLLQNQTDIGNAIKPYYGNAAGRQLTKLLKEHINGAVDLLVAAKAGDEKRVKKASRAWYRNGNEIADFLNAANPDNWPRAEMRSMMRKHLNQTLREATQHMQGHHKPEVHTYDHIVDHILAMADTLSTGIMAQFPEKFE